MWREVARMRRSRAAAREGEPGTAEGTLAGGQGGKGSRVEMVAVSEGKRLQGRKISK